MKKRESAYIGPFFPVYPIEEKETVKIHISNAIFHPKKHIKESYRSQQRRSKRR